MSVMALAAEPYQISEIEVHDGDTIKATIDLGLNVSLTNQSIRLYGIDTPEINSKNELEKQAATLVRDWLINKINSGKLIEIKSVSREKYGRILANLFVDNVDICSEMVKLGYGKSYYGEKKTVWTNEQLQSIINSLETKK